MNKLFLSVITYAHETRTCSARSSETSTSTRAAMAHRANSTCARTIVGSRRLVPDQVTMPWHQRQPRPRRRRRLLLPPVRVQPLPLARQPPPPVRARVPQPPPSPPLRRRPPASAARVPRRAWRCRRCWRPLHSRPDAGQGRQKPEGPSNQAAAAHADAREVLRAGGCTYHELLQVFARPVQPCACVRDHGLRLSEDLQLSSARTTRGHVMW